MPRRDHTTVAGGDVAAGDVAGAGGAALAVAAVLAGILGAGAPAAGEVLQWDFAGDLTSTTGHAPLEAAAADPAAAPGVTFRTATITGAPAPVAEFTRGTFFRLSFDLPANGGGRFLNEYTLILDVLFPDRSPSGGWASLLQTNRNNVNDGDWFIDPRGRLGISGVYGGSVPEGEWHRLALVADLPAGRLTSYVDGAAVQSLDGQSVDGRFALFTDTVSILADENGENAGGLIASLQFRDVALGPAQIAALGGPAADGIPGAGDAPPPPGGGGLVSWWTFDEAGVDGDVVVDRAGSHDGVIHGDAILTSTPPAIVLDGATTWIELAGDPAAEITRAFTVEAWVALDAGTRWGGIAGVIQDNGSFEKGWLLGYDSTSFTIALSTSGKLEYLTASSSYQLGAWHHVAATYDGATLRLFVDGRLERSSPAHTGDIDYAPAPYVLGVYKDDNEFYPLEGRLHEVRVYDVALSAAEIAAHHGEKAGTLSAAVAPIALGPFVRFLAPDRAAIAWETAEPTMSIVDYGSNRLLETRIEDDAATRIHEVTVTALERRTTYFYSIVQVIDGAEVPSDVYRFSTEFSGAVRPVSDVESPYPADALTPLYEAAAEEILTLSGVTRGYCLVHGASSGRLAFELARRSDLRLAGVEENGALVDEGRRLLRSAGVYGSRITLHRRSLDSLPYTANCFNLIVSDRMAAAGTVTGSAAELFRVLRPDGGVAILGQPQGARGLSIAALEDWLGKAGIPFEEADGPGGNWRVVRRGPLEGAGEWTHMYGDAGQTASSGDTLVSGERMRIQWFGKPGPRGFIDRQSRNQTPLTAAGRLYVEGDDRIWGLDAYNGAILWSLEIPGLRRVNIPRDTGNMCADGDSLYVAVRDACWRLDGGSGDLARVYCVESGLPPGAPAQERRWGYIASAGGLLLGSTVSPGAHYTEFKGPQKWYDATSGGFGTAMVTSAALFALEKESGERVWTREGGVIVNPTISAGGGRLYLIESRDPSVAAAAGGRIDSAALWRSLFLVALDLDTGETIWERSITLPASPRPLVCPLVYAEETIVAVLSTSRYHLRAWSAADGSALWSASHPWNRDHHGGHMYHPVIADGMLIVEPRAYDLASGDVVIGSLPVRGGCSTMSAAAFTVHYVDWDYHNGAFGFWDVDSNARTVRAGSRASCWISLISGGGMVLCPTGSAGCVCRYPLQTSIGYRSW